MSARFRSNVNPMLRSPFAETIFMQKYAHENCMAWSDLCKTLVEDVCRDKMSKEDKWWVGTSAACVHGFLNPSYGVDMELLREDACDICRRAEFARIFWRVEYSLRISASGSALVVVELIGMGMPDIRCGLL